MLRSFVEFGRRGAKSQGDELDEHRAKIEQLADVEERIVGSDFIECINCAKVQGLLFGPLFFVR